MCTKTLICFDIAAKLNDSHKNGIRLPCEDIKSTEKFTKLHNTFVCNGAIGDIQM